MSAALAPATPGAALTAAGCRSRVGRCLSSQRWRAGRARVPRARRTCGWLCRVTPGASGHEGISTGGGRRLPHWQVVRAGHLSAVPAVLRGSPRLRLWYAPLRRPPPPRCHGRARAPTAGSAPAPLGARWSHSAAHLGGGVAAWVSRRIARPGTASEEPGQSAWMFSRETVGGAVRSRASCPPPSLLRFRRVW